jgi:mRNA interferase HigB
VRVIARSTLKKFWERKGCADSEQSILSWFAEAKSAEWKNPNHVKDQYSNASILKRGRVVFNIAGNKYRLVVKINYDKAIVYIRFIGTHEQYDEIDPETI